MGLTVLKDKKVKWAQPAQVALLDPAVQQDRQVLRVKKVRLVLQVAQGQQDQQDRLVVMVVMVLRDKKELQAELGLLDQQVQQDLPVQRVLRVKKVK
tara:strand:- start:1243 stop:1533 length:291 start_codon:yes stop_codon:yes gene_type:complete